VEVMLSCMILAIVIIGTGAYLTHARAGVVTQQLRRLGMEAAAARLENVRASPYEAIKPPEQNFNLYYLSRAGSNWVHTTSDPEETVTLLGRDLPMGTTVRYVDLNGGTPSFDAVEIVVTAAYRTNVKDRASLTTYYAF
jgi:hypothetical protein